MFDFGSKYGNLKKYFLILYLTRGPLVFSAITDGRCKGLNQNYCRKHSKANRDSRNAVKEY